MRHLNIRKKISLILCCLLSCTLLTGCIPGTPGDVFAEIVHFAEVAESYENTSNLPEIELAPYEPSAEVPASSGAASDITVPEYDDSELGTGLTSATAQTIMVYMVGSDLESRYGNATLDLQEMMDSGMDTANNNLVVYTGGAEKWQVNGLSAEENAVLLMENGEFSIIETTDANNMGESDTLSSFIQFCYDNFKTESYSLILWDHGGGPVFGFGVDENYDDLLTLEEIKYALDSSVGAFGQPLEWIGFDACLMNSMEIADILAPYAKYMVASQETEPGWGWYYEFLSEWDEVPMPGDLAGELIIDYYMAYGEYVFQEYPKMYSDLTLSCIDLQKYPAAEEALNACFAELDDSLTPVTFPELVRNREDARDFGSYSTDFNYSMVDAIHLLELLADNSFAALDAIESIEDMVVYSQTNMDNAYGISVCYPYRTTEDYRESYIEILETLGFASEYTGFLRNFYALEKGEPISKSWDISKSIATVNTTPVESETVTSTSDITLQLTEEQAANYASGGYYILCKAKEEGYISKADDPRADDMYLYVHGSRNVDLDDNGVLHAYYNNNVIYMKDLTENELSDIPMILSEKDSTDYEKRFHAFAVLMNFGDELTDWVIDSAQLQIVVSDEYPNGLIRSAVPLSDEEEDVQTPGKQLIDLDDYDTLSLTARCSYVTRDADGKMMDFFDWEQSGWLMGFEQDLNNEYELQVLPLQNPENYVCLFFVKDAQGNISYSDLIPLK